MYYHEVLCTKEMVRARTIGDDNSLLGEAMSICLSHFSRAYDPTIEHPCVAMLDIICLRE